jgi:leader peptidase (prepilin peptidase) / N-methyltransferase
MVALLAVGYGVLGLVAGAYLNVLIDRVPDKLPLRGALDGEPVPAALVLGVPFQSWLARRGRTPADASLPKRWMRVEVLTALAFGALGARYGDGWVVVGLLILTGCLISVSVIDLQVLRIPDRITFPTLGLSVVVIVVVSLVEGIDDAITGAGVGLLTYTLILGFFHMVYPRGLGFGDVKLALVMGLYVGWMGWTSVEPVVGPVMLVLYAIIGGCLLGVVFGLAVTVARRKRGAFPFGPALALACYGVVLFAPELRY